MADLVNHPPHYTEGFGTCSVECIDVSQYLGFCLGNAFKYIWRAGKKGDAEKTVEDLKKARWYLIRATEYRLMPSREGVFASRGVFNIIPPPSTDSPEYARWSILSAIVNEHYMCALNAVETWLISLHALDDYSMSPEQRERLELIKDAYY